MAKKRRQRRKEKTVRLYETMDYWIVTNRIENLDEQTKLLKAIYLLDLYGLMDEATVGLKMKTKDDPIPEFKYLLVPKNQRNYYLQRIALNYFINQVPCVFKESDVALTLKKIKQKTIFNGLPFRCFSEKDEYLLSFSLPYFLRERIWEYNLKNSSLEISPKMIFPSLYLYENKVDLSYLNLYPIKNLEICFGGLIEFYSRYVQNEEEKSNNKQKKERGTAIKKQADFLHFINQKIGFQLIMNSIGIKTSWKWADKDKDFSKDLSDEVPSMEKMKELQIERTDKVCHCSPHIRKLSSILYDKKINIAVFFSFFVTSVMEMNENRPILYAVALNTESYKYELTLWWPSFSNIKVSFYNEKDLEDLPGLEDLLFERDEKYPDAADTIDSYISKKIKEVGNPKKVKAYFCVPESNKKLNIENEINTKDDDGIIDQRRMDVILRRILPSFCKKCGLLCPIPDEILLEIVRREKREYTDLCRSEMKWIN